MIMENSQGILFADSTRPQLISSMVNGGFLRVAAYADGLYKWPPEQLARFSRHFLISVTGDPLAARYARCKDIERYDAVPGQFPGFARERKVAGHDDATAYIQISNVVSVVEAMEAAGLRHEPWWCLWVAWWTEDGQAPTRDEIVTELAVAYDLQIEPERIKACQFKPGPDHDTSIWYGADDFTRR